MKKILVVMILFSIALFGYAQDEPKRFGGPGHFINVEKMKKDLLLTDEQYAKIEALMGNAKKTFQAQQIEIDKIKISIREELIKDNPNFDVIKQLVDNKYSILADIETTAIKRDFDIKQILTKEQFNKWKELMKQKSKNKMDKMMKNHKMDKKPSQNQEPLGPHNE